jgi:hypothetical protein
MSSGIQVILIVLLGTAYTMLVYMLGYTNGAITALKEVRDNIAQFKQSLYESLSKEKPANDTTRNQHSSQRT